MPLPLRRFRQRHPILVRRILIAGVFAAAFGAGVAVSSWTLVCGAGRCPGVDVLEAYTPRQTSKVYAADGRFITELGFERRTLVKLADIPVVVRDAFLATEDKRFYTHHGIDFIRMFGAGFRNILSGGYAQGFSTITMQLARNVFPERISREKSLVRKLKEVKVALAIERKYSKDRILELYLNQIYLGSGAHGVETASQRYFGKSVRDLNLAEAAMLAALPKAPSRYDPRRFPDRAVQRRNTIIELMRQDGLVGAADASMARAYPLQLAGRIESGDIAPYYIEWIRQQLDQRFGQRLYEQGLKVYTTLDLDLQSAAERALENELRAIEAGKYGPYRHQSFEQYLARNSEGEGDARNDANSPYLQGAFVAMDPRTGAVLAMVGGRDFDDSKFNRATQALRQPGSTFKPILYSTAIQAGYSPSYLLDDEPLAVPQVDGTDWTPQNFDLKFEGRMTLRRAFYQSRNIPAIRLGMQLGEQAVIDEARKFGITTPIPPYPSIHIGAADVYPLELIAAYSTFATLGTRAAPFGITKVESADGRVLWQQTPQLTTILTPQQAWIMVDMMKDVITKGSAAGTVGPYFHLPAGGKTGTTNDGADVWFVGYTSDLVAGVWIGLDKPAKIKANAQGGLLAAPAWTAFMNEVYRRKPAPPDWPRPEGIVSRDIDFTTDMLRTQYCPSADVMTEVYIAGTEPTKPCDVHTAHGIVLKPDTTPAVLVPRKPGGPDTTSPFYIPPRKKPGGGGGDAPEGGR
ncbi:MAG: PBP1A family penicillin-binding protein [Gemmatimonadota bacterium]|nr:PBP1A family penicillin-binding protein [Gemmatimonadota bacterium]MDE3174420.1 PBP1A family penicillin-binding protein [Gemmatimonadota bacterium]MDE3214983.1 PBP1A family penicillin-binding protein [Gemmatimonadota bacterium]